MIFMSKYKYTIKDCHKLAKERNGTFNSPSYLKASTKYSWKCGIPKHPVFEKSLTQVNQGQWCPKCRYIKASNTLRGRSTKSNIIYDIEFCKNLAKPYLANTSSAFTTTFWSRLFCVL